LSIWRRYERPTTNYEPFIERDLAAIPRAVREFSASHGSEEAWKAVARFAVLAYAPAQHAKHALLCCLSVWEIRDLLGERFDDALVECAIYAATSRQPWSEPPILDPPPPDPSARLRGADRLEAERWLATSFDPAHYFEVASDDFEDLGHKLIIANAAYKLANLLGEKGRYAALRVGVWEMTAYGGARYAERGGSVTMDRLADNMLANRGDIESAHAVFLYDAAMETGQEKRVGDYLAQLPVASCQLPDRQPATGNWQPIYRYARDCGAYLKSHAIARRRGIKRIIPAAWDNLEHGPSLEAFSFA
jgi:hypothetical protein